MLNKVKQVRNASAHNTCMLNNLYARIDNSQYKPNHNITRFLGLANVNGKMLTSKLSNEVLYQITIVFYIHKENVKSNSLKSNRYKELNEVISCYLDLSKTIFDKHDLIKTSIEYLYKISKYLNDTIGIN